MSEHGKVSVITGATGGMGRFVVTELARRGGTVVAVVRAQQRGEQLRRQVAQVVGADRVEVFAADLTAREAVHGLAGRITDRHPELHLLVNNAGAHFREHLVDADGGELHVAVDHLAGFVLTERLRAALTAGAPARVVNVLSASMFDSRQIMVGRQPVPNNHKPAHLDDLRSINPAKGYRPFIAYARAKLLSAMTGYVAAQRRGDAGVTVNALHPGLAGTGVVDDMIAPYLKPFAKRIKASLLPPEEAAASILRLATDPALDRVTGRYFDRDTEASTPAVSYDEHLRQRVWDLSMTAVQGFLKKK